MSQLHAWYLERAREAIDNVLASESARTDAYTLGYASGLADKPGAPTTTKDMLNRVASWLEANQLPLTEPHTTESLMRRRVTAFLRDLAGRDFDVTGTKAAIEVTKP